MRALLESAGLQARWARAIESLGEYIRIPNQSPAFDPEWQSNGLLDRAVDHVAAWCEAELPGGASVQVERLPGRAPMLMLDVPGDGAGTALCYGHVDKQPPMLPWAEGLNPYDPVLRDGRLYGRGGADDGYAAYAVVTALASLADAGVPRPRCVALIEACEESGSPDLPAYLEALEERIGSPDLVLCLDSGCGDYERLWVTTSLRGAVIGTLSVAVLSEGVHSGDAGGIVPDTARILRMLLDRVEHPLTGDVALEAARVPIPEHRRREAAAAAEVLGSSVTERFPFLEGVGPVAQDPLEAILARTWRASMAVHGAAGMPALEQAGNVLRPETKLKFSVRLPPGASATAVAAELKQTLEVDPPYGAMVGFQPEFVADGWDAPALAPWLGSAVGEAARRWFGHEPCFMGEGGTIPFMGMLAERFPGAQFLTTGVLGPQSNAHGPNEFLHVDYARQLVGCIADVIAATASR